MRTQQNILDSCLIRCVLPTWVLWTWTSLFNVLRARLVLISKHGPKTALLPTTTTSIFYPLVHLHNHLTLSIYQTPQLSNESSALQTKIRRFFKINLSLLTFKNSLAKLKTRVLLVQVVKLLYRIAINKCISRILVVFKLLRRVFNRLLLCKHKIALITRKLQ